MIILLPGNPGAFGNRLPPPSEVGFLLSPRQGFRKHEALLAEYSWALDCEIFTGRFDWEKYLARVERATEHPGKCRFIVVPDVPGDARETLSSWVRYSPRLRETGLPLAYCAQDGLTRLPEVEFDVLFIGGTTLWKTGPVAAGIIRDSVSRSIPVHMGRVNTIERLRYAYHLGVSSVDGTRYGIAPYELFRDLPFLRAMKDQRDLFSNQ
jgi:hypothetical protein